MIEIYKLNELNNPAIPNPHDCVIKKITIEKDWLIFEFEDDISYHDSINYLNINAKSLIIRYHLIDDFNTYFYRLKGLFRKEGFELVTNEELTKFNSDKLEYLYHNTGYQSIIIKLWCRNSILIDLSCDYIEYEWIEK
ncbi:MAG: hypothetical protein ACI35S_06550 [Anaeroplasma sp.]